MGLRRVELFFCDLLKGLDQIMNPKPVNLKPRGLEFSAWSHMQKEVVIETGIVRF